MKETLCKLKEMFLQEAICPLLEHDGVKVAQVTQPFNRTFPRNTFRGVWRLSNVARPV